jgi:hypothetical protein
MRLARSARGYAEDVFTSAQGAHAELVGQVGEVLRRVER